MLPTNTSLLVEQYDQLPFLGLPITQAGLRNFHYAVRSLIEVDKIEVILSRAYLDTDVPGSGAMVNDRGLKENRRIITRRAMLAAWVLEGWHPYRVGRYLQLDQPEIHAEMLEIYLALIANAPPNLRQLLIGIITGEVKQAFLSGHDMREVLVAEEQRYRTDHGYDPSRIKLNHCKTCRCIAPSKFVEPSGFHKPPVTIKDIPNPFRKKGKSK